MSNSNFEHVGENFYTVRNHEGYEKALNHWAARLYGSAPNPLSTNMTNLNPISSADEKFLGERYTRELMSTGLAWCTLNMSDKDLRCAIITDLVSFVMWEKEKNTKLHITFEELTRFVDRSDVQRIRQQLDHSEIKHLFDFDGNVYRMKDDRAVLQAAMDFTGIWYDSYVPPEGEKDIIKINHEVLADAVEKHGGIDNLAKALAMDLVTNVPASSQLN